MNHLVSFSVPIAFIAMVVLVVYFSAKFQYQTKKAIIEKGGNIEFPKKKFPILEIGCTILGVGLGLGVAALFQLTNFPGDSKDLLTGSFILLFGGAGLVSGYFIRRKLEKENK